MIRRRLVDERFRWMGVVFALVTYFTDRALRMQAEEYRRRLDVLNHAHEKAVEVQHTYVTQEKYDANSTAATVARDIALTRVDERFDDHVKRYELRQRELDQALDIQKGAATEVKRAVEAAERRQTRNLTVAGLALAAVIGAFNTVPGL